MERIDYWHTTLPCMGTRKIAAKLRTEGYAVGRKLVRAYMQEMGIHAVYPRPNLSRRNFKESRELRQAIRQYVCDYNTLRPHQALDYQTPEDAYLACFAPPSAGLDRTPLAC